MEKTSLTSSTTSPAGETDQVSLSDVMDVAGLILYDTEATPIRLKVLLDRLLSSLSHDQVLHVLSAYAWSYEDFCRGYKLQVVGPPPRFRLVFIQLYFATKCDSKNRIDLTKLD